MIMAMNVPEKVLQYQFHLIVGTLFSILLVFLLYLAPSFVTILSYFWPLFLSTTVFLVVVMAFGLISPPASATYNDRTGEELIDYVAGQQQHPQGEVQDTQKWL